MDLDRNDLIDEFSSRDGTWIRSYEKVGEYAVGERNRYATLEFVETENDGPAELGWRFDDGELVVTGTEVFDL